MEMVQSVQVFLESGGFTAWLILGAGILLVIFTLDRFMALFGKLSVNSVGAIKEVHDSVIERDYTKALQVCNQNQGAPMLDVIRSGLIAVENGREAMRSALENKVLEISDLCEERMQYIALIAGTATLLGLLGTVTGLIKTFDAIAAADAASKASMLGKGIAEAMNSTASGLIVGLIAMTVHAVCTTKADKIVGEAQRLSLKLVTWVEQSERKAK